MQRLLPAAADFAVSSMGACEFRWIRIDPTTRRRRPGDAYYQREGRRRRSGPAVVARFPSNAFHVETPRRRARRSVHGSSGRLRGYGDSSQVTDKADHSSYSFRAMAADQVEVMATLGFDRFTVIGHDRGARVAHRMATDKPSVVERLGLLDILPTSYMYSHLDRQVATAYYHWLFFVQPYDLPERLIGADPSYYLRSLLGRWGTASATHQPEALTEYERCFSNASVRHAMMEDYRAGASIDLEHDDEGSLIAAPTLVLWGERGVVARAEGGPLTIWRDKAVNPQNVEGFPIPAAGHFLIEEAYEPTRDLIVDFLRA